MSQRFARKCEDSLDPIISDQHNLNNDDDEGDLHTNFKFSSSGEEIGLFDPNLNLIDQISFGDQLDDISYGRVTDGSYSWQSFDAPTPGSSNSGENPCQPGDINCDNEVNILDVVSALNLVLEGEYDSTADLNNDGVLNILDIIQLVNIILNNYQNSVLKEKGVIGLKPTISPSN